MTSDDLIKLLLTQYSLSDLEFGLGATIEDLKFGLEDFVDNFYQDIIDMLKDDDLWEGPSEEE